MSATLALRNRTVVTADAGTHHFVMINRTGSNRNPGRVDVAGLTNCGTGNVVQALAAGNDAIVTDTTSFCRG